MGAYRWVNMNSLGSDLGLLRDHAVVHNGMQFAETQARSVSSVITSAAFPPAYFQRYPTSSGIFQLSSDGGGTQWVLHRSPDGFAAYAEVLRGNTTYASGYQAAVVDCGNGKLIYCEYGPDASGSRVYYSKNSGVSWGNNHPNYNDGDPLFATFPGAVRHLHGGKYDPVYNRLYLFSGDDPTTNSIMWCDDIDHLAANPATWSARWGLDDVGRTTIDDAWIARRGDLVCRCVDALFAGDYMYFGSDSLNPPGQPVGRVHRLTHAFEPITVKSFSTKYDHGNALGEVWLWGVTSSGVVVMCGSASLASSAGGDGLMHVYALEPSGLAMTEIYQVQRTNPAGLAIPHRIDILGDYVIISNRLLLPNVMGKVVTNTASSANASDERSRMSNITLTPRKFNPWNRPMKTGIVTPAYNPTEMIGYKFGPDAQATTPANRADWLYDSGNGAVANQAGTHYVTLNRWNVSPGVKSITSMRTRFGFTQQDTTISGAHIEVWKKTATHYVRVATSNLIASVGGIAAYATQTWTPSAPVSVTLAAGEEYYIGLRMVRTATAGATVPQPGMVTPTNYVYENVRIAISPSYDWTTNGVPLTNVAGSTYIRNSASAMMIEATYASDSYTEMEITTPAVGRYLVPVASALPYVVKLEGVVVADTKSLTIVQSDYPASTGSPTVADTTKLDCGEAVGGTDTLLDGGNTITLPTISLTRQAGKAFDFVYGYNKVAGRANLFYKCRELEDLTHCHAVKQAGTRGSNYTYAGGREFSFAGTFAIAKLLVGVRPLVYMGDSQCIAATQLPDGNRWGTVHTRLTKPRIYITHGGPGKMMQEQVTTNFMSATPGNGDGVELAGYDCLWFVAGMGINDASYATTTTANDARETVSLFVHALTTISEQIFLAGDELILAGLPPYSYVSATPSEDEYMAKSVRWMNRALLGLALAWKVSFYNPWPDTVQSGTEQGTIPVFKSTYTSDVGLHYSAAGGALVCPKMVANYENAAIDLRDAWD